jgi:hypothetical protein
MAAQAADAAAPAQPALAYPPTRRADLVETQFGAQVADPYRWLENDVRNDAEVKAWVDAQNVVTNQFFTTLPGREALEKRITELYDYERFGVPTKKGGRYFYAHNSGLQNQSVLFVRDSLDGEGRGRLEVAGVPGAERVVAAHFEREDLARRVGELAIERRAGAGRSGEEQAIEPRMGGERLAGVGPALDAADDALGHAGDDPRWRTDGRQGRGVGRRVPQRPDG